MIPVLSETTPDPDLWHLVLQGRTDAFEILLRRYQSLVCAVAYSACGNRALSEDVAQETFWAAWRERKSLAQPSRLRPWLCGIARNLGKNAGRKAARPIESAAALDSDEILMEAPEPLEEVMSREEESLVWGALEELPETYREPLILFYRENQSAMQVAAALDLSEDAVKQRLSRGRGMLRERVAGLVEAGLRRSRPGRAFTVAVMTGLTAGTGGLKTATAAGLGGASKAVGGPIVNMAAGVAGGTLGGLLGSLIGLSGAWLGTWVPAQLAPTRSERELILRTGRRVMLISLLFLAVLAGLVWTLAGGPYYAIAWGIWFAAFQFYVIVESVRLGRAVKRFRAVAKPTAEPNESEVHARAVALASRFRGRIFRTRKSLLGLPLIEINVGDPMALDRTGHRDGSSRSPRTARGWIAVGDEARGILLAIGSRAYGLVALGGVAVGMVSIGGISIGLIAVGGLALGGLALGGLAIGWQACGGGAIAWDIACGGFAAARHAAIGGGAFAYDYALGGGGWAAHFNDDAARAQLLAYPLKGGMDWYLANNLWITPTMVLTGLLFSAAIVLLLYRRENGRRNPIEDL